MLGLAIGDGDFIFLGGYRFWVLGFWSCRRRELWFSPSLPSPRTVLSAIAHIYLIQRHGYVLVLLVNLLVKEGGGCLGLVFFLLVTLVVG